MGFAILLGIFAVALAVVIMSVVGLAMFVAHVLHSGFVAARSLVRRGSFVPPDFYRRRR